MRTAPVKAIALPAVYRANLKCQSHMRFQHYRFAHMWTSRVLHFSAFIEKSFMHYIMHALNCLCLQFRSGCHGVPQYINLSFDLNTPVY